MTTPALPDRAVLAGDPLRPHYHFLPPANWMNDPNGMIQWGGAMHLFYQYNPHGAFHGTIHWGHASSTDLVHWRDHPVALFPQPGGADADGCWSGCAVDDGGTPTFLYTGVQPQTVCVATSADGLETWQQLPGNPVIAAPPPEIAAHSGHDFRDPYVWREEDAWYMVIGARREGSGGLTLLYRSPDLRQWEFVRVLLAGDEAASPHFYEGAMWECPNLLDFGARRALILSIQDAQNHLHHAAYFAGPYREHTFTPDGGGVLAHGGSFYAPQATRLADGRILLFGWLREQRPLDACMAAGWNGAMSLPLIVSMTAAGGVRLDPAAELATLRGPAWTVSDLAVAPHGTQALPVRGDALEIDVEFAENAAAEYGLAVRCSPDGSEQTRIVVRPGRGELAVQRVGELDAGTPAETRAPLAVPAGKRVRLRVFVDASVLEIFANDDCYMAVRLYPRRADSLGVTLFAGDAPVDVARFTAWPLASIW